MKKLFYSLALILAAQAFNSSALADADVYTIDSVHSGINFKIRHFVAKTPGTFTNFQGEVHYDPENPANNKAIATISVNSIDTRNNDRDDHLREDEYFNAAKFPEIRFESTHWKKVGENQYEMHGNLTMLGRTLPVVVDTEYIGTVEHPFREGQMVGGWSGATTIDRTQWGLTAGQLALGNDVEIELNIQANKQ